MISSTRPITAQATPTGRWYEPILESGLLPDWLVRAGIRRVIAERLREQEGGPVATDEARLDAFVDSLRHSPIAVHTEAANAQHYEVPAAFYEQVLGPRLKYSAAYWPPGVHTLDDAEEAMLALTADRAGIFNGDRVLDLGCGWGAFTLFVAQRFPACRVTGLSNSASQRAWIEARAAALGLTNVSIVTGNVASFDTDERFDRVVSVEMFEHMRNHRALLARVAGWLRPGGALFVHVFSHTRFAYLYEARDSSDWMAQHFFTGGMMPADGLLPRFQDDLTLERHWRLDGSHYARTAEAWLARMDAHRGPVDSALAAAYGPTEVTRWRVRWRVFFMACAELFAYRYGAEWIVSHYRFRKND